MARFCEHGNGLSCSIRGCKFYDQLRDYKLLKKTVLHGGREVIISTKKSYIKHLLLTIHTWREDEILRLWLTSFR
jgi:hypothetical protein